MQTSHSNLDIAELIASADWRQRWEILPGIWTPGISDLDAKYMLDEYGIPADLAGKTCIDIGAWDGPISFELERRGAKVIAAEGEFQASAKLADAATVMSAAPGALQLRYLQTLVEIGAEANTTTLFPIPMNLIDGLQRLVEPRDT